MSQQHIIGGIKADSEKQYQSLWKKERAPTAHRPTGHMVKNALGTRRGGKIDLKKAAKRRRRQENEEGKDFTRRKVGWKSQVMLFDDIRVDAMNQKDRINAELDDSAARKKSSGKETPRQQRGKEKSRAAGAEAKSQKGSEEKLQI